MIGTTRIDKDGGATTTELIIGDDLTCGARHEQLGAAFTD